MRQYLVYDRMDVRNDGLVMGNDVLQDLMDVWWHDISFPFTVGESSAVLAEDELHKAAPVGKVVADSRPCSLSRGCGARGSRCGATYSGAVKPQFHPPFAR